MHPVDFIAVKIQRLDRPFVIEIGSSVNEVEMPNGWLSWLIHPPEGQFFCRVQPASPDVSITFSTSHTKGTDKRDWYLIQKGEESFAISQLFRYSEDIGIRAWPALPERVRVSIPELM